MGHLSINPVIGNVLDECLGEKHGEKNVDGSINQYLI